MQRLNLNAPGCTEFLKQFDHKDVPLAKAILSNVRFVSASEYVQWLQERLRLLGEQDDAPVAFLIVRQLDNKVEDDPFHFAGTTPGSEGRDAHIMKAVAKSSKRKWFVAPNIEKMIEKKVRRIVFICDTVGSGQELTRYVDAVFKNPKIKSWVSNGWIQRIDIAAGVVMDKGASVWSTFVRSVRYSQKVLGASHLQDLNIDAFYNPAPITKHKDFRREQLRALLMDYARTRLSLRKPERFGLGYKKSEGSVVFEPNVPNNLPALLWMDSNNWEPLFRGRSMDRPELFEETDSQSNEQQSQDEHGEHRYRATREERELLDILTKTKSYTQICRRMRDTPASVTRSIECLRRRGWVSAEDELTELGKEVLRLDRERNFDNDIARLAPTEIYIPLARSRGSTDD